MDLRTSAFLAALLTALPVCAQPKLEPPVPVRTVAPTYPFDLRRDGVEGIVLISCVIDPVGNVTELMVEKTTHTAFSQPALDAVKKWKFTPAKLDGNPVAKKIMIPIKFNSPET